jgi:hypothetical protein
MSRSRPCIALSCLSRVCESVRGRERKTKRGYRERVCVSVRGRERKIERGGRDSV